MIKKEIILEKDKKISVFLQDFGFTYADVNKILRNKDLKVNGVVQKTDVELNKGDSVCFYFSENMLEKRFERIFEDENVVVIYKFSGIESEGMLESVLKATAVHRLDRNTEGLMVYAKTEFAKEKLDSAFKDKKVHKFYLAEVVGKADFDKTYKAYLIKDSEKSKVKIFDKKMPNSEEILTKIKTISAKEESSLLEIELLTGKTHQIRAHLAFLGHPIIGDGKYGKNEDNKRFKQFKQRLCCFKLKFDFVGIDSLNFKEFQKYPIWNKNIK